MIDVLMIKIITLNGNVILIKFPSLATLEVVKMTTSSVASDENFIKMTFLLYKKYCGTDCFDFSADQHLLDIDHTSKFPTAI